MRCGPGTRVDSRYPVRHALDASARPGKGHLLESQNVRRIAAVAAVLVAVFIVATTLTPVAVDESGCAFGIPCTAGHFLAFGALGFTLAGVYATSRLARVAPRRALAMMFLAVWIFAALDELAQAAVGRDASLADWIADMAGALVGMLLGGFVLRALVSRSRGNEPDVDRGAPLVEPRPHRSKHTSRRREAAARSRR
jgi:VanZ family protein